MPKLPTRIRFALPLLGETEPEALRMGYVTDVSRVDRTRFNAYSEGQICANCSYY